MGTRPGKTLHREGLPVYYQKHIICQTWIWQIIGNQDPQIIEILVYRIASGITTGLQFKEFGIFPFLGH
jgi:hypothetical protein